MTIGATLFSGGGGVEALLKHRIDFRYAVEYDPAIAAVYRANHGDHVQVARVEDVDYSLWGALDYLHASPVCKEFSQAKTGGTEGEGDLSSALAVVRCLEQTTPRVFTLENVGAYQHSKSYKLICRALDLAGYMWHAEVLNAADFGVPQTRRRLILRAVRDSLLPGWPAPVRWVGWYAAIEDLIPTLPPSQFAAWQLARLPEGLSVTFLGNYNNTGDKPDEKGYKIRLADEPCYSVTSDSTYGKARAFIVAQGCYGDALVTARHHEPTFAVTANSNQSGIKAWFVNEDSKMGVYADDAPAPAQVSSARARKARALLVNGENMSRDLTIRHDDEPAFVTGASASVRARAWLQSGRVVKMTPRALARFQSLPDSYILPDKASLACTVIGNAVPSLLMQQIVEPLL
jgi:DNA-cytosine methyltransferase